LKNKPKEKPTKKQQIEISDSEKTIDLRNCDYKEIIKEINANKIKIDCILTDPPYGVSRTHQLGFSNMGRAGMDYGSWDYGFNQREYIKLCGPIIKEGGSFIIFNDWKNLSYIVEELGSQGFLIKDLIRWEKSNPMPRNVNSRYVMDYEVAVWAVKGTGKWTFNKPKDTSYLKPVFKTGVVLGGIKRIHPTQKHLDLFIEIIKIHTNKNELIFDPFSGSGTTALACKVLGRKFIGSEIDKKYFERATDRINGYIPS